MIYPSGLSSHSAGGVRNQALSSLPIWGQRAEGSPRAGQQQQCGAWSVEHRLWVKVHPLWPLEVPAAKHWLVLGVFDFLIVGGLFLVFQVFQ